MSNPSIVWTSSNVEVATISTLGLLRALAPGAATVTASSGTVSASSRILVTLPQFTIVVRRSPGVFGNYADSTILADSGATLQYAFQLMSGYSDLRVSVDGAPAPVSGPVLADRGHVLLASADRDLPSAPAISNLAQQLRAVSASADFASAMHAAVESVSVMTAAPAERNRWVYAAGIQAFGNGPMQEEELDRMRTRAGSIIAVSPVPDGAIRSKVVGQVSRTPKVIFINGVFNDYGDYLANLSSLSTIAKQAGVGLDGFFNPTWTSNPDYPTVACLLKISYAVATGASLSNTLPLALKCTLLFDLVTSRRQIENVMGGFPSSAVPIAQSLASRIKTEIDAGFAPVLLGHSQGTLMVAEALKTLYSQIPAASRLSTARCLTSVALAAPVGPVVVGAEQWRGIVLEGASTFDIILVLGTNAYPRLNSAITAAADVEVGRWYNLLPPLNALSVLTFDFALHSLTYGYLGAPESTGWLQSRIASDARLLSSQCTDVGTMLPSTMDIAVGGNAQFTATRSTPTGKSVPAPTFVWSTDNPSIARVDATAPGRIIGVAPGTVTVSASSGDAVAQSTLTVTGVASAPAISLDRSAVTFAQSVYGSPPGPQLVSITNGGTGALTGLSLGSVSYSSGQASGWLAATLANSAGPTSVTLSIVAVNLAAGTYTATLPILASATGVTNSPRNVIVTLTVSSVASAPAISVDRASVPFSFAIGGALPAIQTVNISNGGSGTLTGLSTGAISYGAGQPAGWLSATLTSSTAPSTLSMAIAPAGLSAGTYSAVVPIASNVAGVTNSPRTVTVSLTVSGSGTANAPTLLSPGSPTSPGQTISTLTPLFLWNVANGATGYGLYVYDLTSNSVAFSSDAIGNITSLSPVALQAGRRYRWNMRGSSASGFSVYSADYYFQTQSSAPPLSISTGALSSATVGVNYTQGIVATGGQPFYSWSVASGLPPGLSIDAASGTISGIPTSPGSYAFTVTVRDNGTPQQIATQSLSITVSGGLAPTITLDRTTVPFAYTVGGAVPALQTVNVTNGGTGTLTGLSIGTVSYAQGQPSGWLSAALTSTTGPTSVSFVVFPGSLSAGSYTATLQLFANVQGVTNSPRAITVTLTVSGAATTPTIALDRATVPFTYTVGGAVPALQTVNVSNSGTGTLSGLSLGVISYANGQPSGWLSAALTSPTAPTSVSFVVFPTSLAPGNYTATVPIAATATGVTNSPRTITVTLTVSASAGPPMITNMTPDPLTGSTSQQTVTIRGTNFVSKPSVSVAWTGGSSTLQSSQVSFVSSTQLTMSINVQNDPDTWRVQVTNPSGLPSNTSNLRVLAATPVLSGMNSSPASPNPGVLFAFTISGSGFSPSSALIRVNGPGCAPCTIANNQLSTKTTSSISGFASLASTGSFSFFVQNGFDSQTGQNGPISGPATVTVVAPVGPPVNGVSPNPVPGLSGNQTLTVNGSAFVNGAMVRLRDLTNGGTFDKATTSFSTTQLQISANFTTAAATWSAQVINPNGGTSTPYNFTVAAPVVPVVTSVSPNPPVGMNSAQPFTINGANFVSGANITLRDINTGQIFQNRVASTFTSTRIVINPNFGATAHSWSVWIVNPDGQVSVPFTFQVRFP